MKMKLNCDYVVVYCILCFACQVSCYHSGLYLGGSKKLTAALGGSNPNIFFKFDLQMNAPIM
jgi:hypothetical protein